MLGNKQIMLGLGGCMESFVVEELKRTPVGRQRVEIVERKTGR